jgi:hypothetical protein
MSTADQRQPKRGRTLGMNDLERRILSLEAAMRRWRAGSMIALAAVLLAVVGGGLLSINSVKPHDHNAMIWANEFGATVQVSFQGKPRQFGFLKIMDGKPYVQLYEDHGKTTKNFYQAPTYFANGNIGSASNILTNAAAKNRRRSRFSRHRRIRETRMA